MTNEVRLDQVRVGLLNYISSNPCGHILKVSAQYLNFWLIYVYIFVLLGGHGHDRS